MIQSFLQSKRLFQLLIIANVLLTLLIFAMTCHETGADAPTYSGLADGILHGRYSFYWFLSDYYPDTLRNPGYPLFLALLKLISPSFMLVRVFQLALYFITLHLALKLVDYYTNGRLLTKNLMLILLLVSINIPAYTTLILPEILTLFLITSSLYLEVTMDGNKWYKYPLLGVVYGFIFQIRPVFIFVPFIKLANDFLYRKTFPIHIYGRIVIIAVFILSMLPYSFWNKANHGVFSVTSLEGGGGVAHSAFWAYKIPDYIEHDYFNNRHQREIISERDSLKVKQNIIAYNREWAFIDSACQQYVTPKDSVLIEYRAKNYWPMFMTYNTKYTLAREKLLKQITMKHFKEEPLYTIKTKVYAFFRIWYTGLFSIAGTPTINYRLPFFLSPYFLVSILSLIVFFIALIFIPFAFIKNYKAMSALLYPILLLLYTGLIHTLFAIQSRYTIPVRLLLIMVIAQALTVTFFTPRPQDLK